MLVVKVTAVAMGSRSSGMSVGFWSNVLLTKWGHGGDNKGGLNLAVMVTATAC